MYSYGKCKSCDKETWLMNDKCSECNYIKEDVDVPDILKEIFSK